MRGGKGKCTSFSISSKAVAPLSGPFSPSLGLLPMRVSSTVEGDSEGPPTLWRHQRSSYCPLGTAFVHLLPFWVVDGTQGLVRARQTPHH